MSESPSADSQNEVRHNDGEQRYELVVDGQLSVAEYRPGDGIITFTHTEVPEQLEGRGIGGRLVKYAVEDAHARGLRIASTCSFVSAYLRRHPEYAG